MTVSKFFFCLLFGFILFLSFLTEDTYAISGGNYLAVSQPGMKVDLADGDYDYWIETPQKIIVLQTGTYEIRGKYIFFYPVASDIGDVQPSRAEIIDECSFTWGKAGIFRRKDCTARAGHFTTSTSKKRTSFSKKENVFPNSWKIFKTKAFEIYIPKGCRVEKNEKISAISLFFKDGEAWIGKTPENGWKFQNMALSGCNMKRAFRKGNSTLFMCGPDSNVRLVQLVQKRDEDSIASFVKAREFSTFKALTIAISSIKFLGKKGPSSKKPSFTKWTPRDGSFSIDIPDGWRASGGTADFGANGYVRIVQVLSPDESAGFLGVYFPFYQFVQTTYGSNGIPPQDALTYIRNRFFYDLKSNFQLDFPGLHFEYLDIDQKLSQKLAAQYSAFVAQNSSKYSVQVVEGRGAYLENGKEFELWVGGVISYMTLPLQGLGYSYIWGPAPIFVEVAQKGELEEWFSTFKHMADSWTPNWQWLSRHFRNAAIEQRNILRHYRRMSDMIHKNAEMRMNQGLMEHEAEESERMEEFWDTFYALGGEERYDNPVTGEEIDLPIGADKYFYDNYSQTWVGVREDVQGSEDLIQALKEKGFVELRLHQH